MKIVKRDINQAHFGDEEQLDFDKDKWDFPPFNNPFQKSKKKIIIQKLLICDNWQW